MANMYKGQVKDEVLKRFRKMGYNIDCRILKACDYGVPQMRKGFEQSRKYKMIGAVEWEPSPVKELRNHLKNRWGIQDSEERVLQFDIQRTEELFNGWKDKKFGESKGLDALVGNRQLDVIIGGPPCQACIIKMRSKKVLFWKLWNMNFSRSRQVLSGTVC